MLTAKRNSTIKDGVWLKMCQLYSRAWVLKSRQKCPMATLRNFGVKLLVFQTVT